MPQDDEVSFTVNVKPETIEVDGYVGEDADADEALALCLRLLGAVREFNRTEPVSRNLPSR